MLLVVETLQRLPLNFWEFELNLKWPFFLEWQKEQCNEFLLKAIVLLGEFLAPCSFSIMPFVLQSSI